MPSRVSLLFVVLFAVAALPRDASAQFETETATHPKVPIAVWGSVGLGPGVIRAVHESRVAGVLRANVSAGAWLLTYRSSDVGPFMDAGPGVRDKGILVGMRTGRHRVFDSASLGYARATPYYQNDNSSAGVLVYDAMLHANAYVIGLAISFSGAIGPSRATYSAVTVGLEAGWFGR